MTHGAGETIRLIHGGGGSVGHRLVEEVFLPVFGTAELAAQDDSAVLDWPAGRLAFTTDSFVVSPLFFPGGDIGRLAVCGTVNDLAVSGARPVALSAGFILEEGLPLGDLRRIVSSMKAAADEAGVRIVAADTKVVERGKGDGLFINTSGVGVMEPGRAQTGGAAARPGDKVVVSGPLGRHGLAVLLARRNLGLEPTIESDVAPLNGMVAGALRAAPDIRVLRDATRGGLGVVLNEIARQSGVCIEIDEAALPVTETVRAACELLGLDFLYVANEGVAAAVVPAASAEAAAAAMRLSPYGAAAAVVGRVLEGPRGRVVMNTGIGGRRVVDWISGEPLPRIC